MDIPGLTGLADQETLERGEREAKRLLEELKKATRVEVQDKGTLRKELRITVPQKVIEENFEHNFKEVRQDAVVPGFRKGHVPQQLLRKRFGGEMRESLKKAVLGQSYFAVLENEKLEVLGDPRFGLEVDGGLKFVEVTEAMDKIKLPESGDFSYVCEVELKPSFELPELEGIPVTAPRIEITEQDVTDEITRQLKVRGRYEPAVDAAAEADDVLIADVTLTCEDKEVKREENVQLGVRPTRLDGIPLLGLADVLRGVKAGEQRSTDCVVPDDYERADLRGKNARFDFKVHEIKRLVPMTLEAFQEQLGANSPEQLRQYVREDMEAEIHRVSARAEKEQIVAYLLNSITLDVPSGLSSRQTDRAVMRRVVELRQRGVPMSEIEAKIDELRTSAAEEVARDLKLQFIFEKVAGKLEIEISEEEMNLEIARIARMYNQRFDRIRDDLQSAGLVPALADHVREEKCIRALLRKANITEVQRPALGEEAT